VKAGQKIIARASAGKRVQSSGNTKVDQLLAGNICRIRAFAEGHSALVFKQVRGTSEALFTICS
jgi:hypothetical protein